MAILFPSISFLFLSKYVKTKTKKWERLGQLPFNVKKYVFGYVIDPNSYKNCVQFFSVEEKKHLSLGSDTLNL